MVTSAILSSFFAIFLLLVSYSGGAPYKKPTTCGYETCNLGKPDKLNVHLVAHTHDDVGWLKTVDQYYYGYRNEICHRGVQYILDSVIEALLENPERRYIYVEMAFFWRWWNEQSDEMHNTVKQLVNEGRLEFISGGWSMNDEATTHYNSIIDQHALGAEFLHDTFGECARPKIGWQIDPFGHSREMASLLAQMGFDGLFFGRIDYQDRTPRTLEKNLEMIWKGSTNLGSESWLFTGVLPHSYSAPFSFCFDILCSDPPVMDDKNLNDYNVQERVDSFLRAAYVQSEIYATNHLIMTMGDDFQDQNANEKFKNLDKLIHYVNLAQENGSNVNVFYSTPSCYLYALNKAQRKWTTKTDDFFPYASIPFVYWTGFYTSRPAFKFYERYANNILQVTRQLNGFSQNNQRNRTFDLSEAMGLAQHHDAVSGTEKQHVVNDYAQRLSEGIKNAMDVVNDAYDKLLSKTNQSIHIPTQFLCPYSNISACANIEGQKSFTITLWNPTVHPVTIHPHVPVTQQYLIRDPSGNIISAEYLPITDTIKNIPGRESIAEYQCVFQASLPALGYSTYYFEIKNETTKHEDQTITMTMNDACILQNEHLRVEISGEGHLKSIVNLDKDITVTFTEQGIYWYASYTSDPKLPELSSSGAYVFRPLIPEALPVSLVRQINCTITDTVQKASIVFNDWVTEEFLVYAGSNAVELDWTVGPIPVNDNVGKEIIIRYNTNINSGSKYYTDANGREVLERIRDHRPTWDYIVDEPISGNYYPINSRIWIRDQSRQLTVLTDRSEGGGSMFDGSIEIMVHRRILHDDSLGVGEPLNETAYGKGLVVTGTHYLVIDHPLASARLHRVAAQQIYMHPLATYSLPNTSYANYSTLFHQTWSALSDTIPMNVHLLTFDQLNVDQYLVRVEHYFEVNEDNIYSKPVSIDLQMLFKSIGRIVDVVELTLTANLPLSELHRLDWTTKENESLSNKNHDLSPSETKRVTTTIELNPMQIRTFKVNIV